MVYFDRWTVFIVLKESTFAARVIKLMLEEDNKSQFFCTKQVNFAKIFAKMIDKMLLNNKLMKTKFWQKIYILPIFLISWKRPSATSDGFS